jgi:hypothetical protein
LIDTATRFEEVKPTEDCQQKESTTKGDLNQQYAFVVVIHSDESHAQRDMMEFLP